MTTGLLQTYGSWAVRIVLAVVFATSGLGKLLDGQNAVHLTETILNGGLDQMGAQILVVAVSGTELTLAGLLIWGYKLTLTLATSFLMVTGFTIGVGTLLGKNQIASCGCFGIFRLGLSPEATIFRNLVLLAIILVGVLLKDRLPKDGT